MPSPFPGVDPYLENPEFWSEVHNRLIVAIADDLSPQLRPKYRVAIEKRTYFSEGDENLLVGIADVAVLKGAANNNLNPVSVMVADQQAPQQVRVPMPEEVRESYLEIREVASGQVITVLELLSPKNKRVGVGRATYDRKRQRVLASDTHLVEIDLLRGGTHLPLVDPVQANCFYILVSRSHQRPVADLYAFTLRQPIPIFPVPLTEGEPEPAVNLPTLLQAVYDRAGLDLVIDYSQPPIPALSESDAEWAEKLLTNSC
ncbi:MAG: DUF4058 family protein [Leptolyngbyaceae cyanobacterium bins.349]|nr:DUF4058 family protein [Leptolyngbyaceae cyanobacterium bins.349]